MSSISIHPILLFPLLFLHSIFCSASPFANSKQGFIENKGQIVDQYGSFNSDVLFIYPGKGLNIVLKRTGFSYEFFKPDNFTTPEYGKKLPSVSSFKDPNIAFHRIDVTFEGQQRGVEIIGQDKHEQQINIYSSGNTFTNISSFRKVLYKNVYPFTDIEFIITENESAPLKYNIILRPGADIHKIKFLYSGGSVHKNENGSLLLSSSLGNIEEAIPFSFYTDSPITDHKITYSLENNTIRFSGSHDKTKTLVIDPSTNRIWGTYLGGNSYDFCTSNGIDASNNIYVAGYTLSTANIATVGAYQTVHAGSYDAYLAKFNSNGNLIWSTYFGGSGFDIFYALHVFPNGTIYAAGDCDSPSGIATPGAHQTTYGGGIDDVLLTRFTSNGLLQWATYYGGNDHDIVVAVTSDSNGNAVITGHTQSPNNISTVSVYNPSFSLAYDVLLAKFDSLGTRLWGTYYGDTGTEEALGVACDASNNIYITGFTTSLFGIATGSAYQTINGGSQDGFIAKFDPAGANLLWGTFYGGGGNDQGTAIEAENTTGKLFITGITTSTNNIATAGAYQMNPGSSDDAFLASFNLSGTNQWGTYYGGNDADYINDLLIDPNKDLVFCGSSLSTNSISTSGAYQPSLAAINYYDAVIAKFTPLGVLKLATYYGGTDNDNAKGIVMDNTGKIYIAGETTSSVSIASPGAFSTTYAGFGDAFLAKFCLAPEPSILPAGTSTLCVNNSFTLTAQGGYSTYVWNTGFNSNPLVLPASTPTGTYNFAVTVSDAFGCNATSDSVQVVYFGCVSVEEKETSSPIRIYPNPAHENIILEFFNNENSEYMVEILSVTGQQIASAKTNENKLHLKTEDLSPGLYFIRIHNSHVNVQQKFIKQ